MRGMRGNQEQAMGTVTTVQSGGSGAAQNTSRLCARTRHLWTQARCR